MSDRVKMKGEWFVYLYGPNGELKSKNRVIMLSPLLEKNF